MKSLLLLVALLTTACSGSSSPAAPTPAPTPAPSRVTLSGTLQATNGGQPLTASITVNETQAAATAGAWSLSVAPSSVYTLRATGAGILDRQVNFLAPGAAVDAIALGSGFDLTFYREFVRNGFEAPATLQPLRRWTHDLNVYIQNHDAFGVIPDPDSGTLTMIESVVRDALPRWTNGQLHAASVIFGTNAPHLNQPDWLSITWDTTSTRCGSSQVGQEGGLIGLRLNSTCACNGWQTSPATVRHELGHAMGFYHTDSPADLMSASADVCDKPISARELYHAAIAYRRRPGNLDPDMDATTAPALAPMRVP